MNYEFPEIKHINEVLPAIDGSAEFIVVDKGDYQVINYVVMNDDTFPPVHGMHTLAGPVSPVLNALRRECRGLIFDKNGVLINRRFHKFFNVNERPETSLNKMDFSQPHHILEKLDGSMVSPCKINGHIRWMTKMGITDTSMEAEYFVATHPEYTKFAEHIINQDCTPIFEWCSRKNRIVLDYSEDKLVLLAIRHNRTGNYVPHDVDRNNGWDIPVVKAWEANALGPQAVIDIVRQQEDTEGVVVRFADGHMVKIKSDWYVRIHKVKSALENEREVVAMTLNNELDDMYPVLPETDVQRIKKYSSKVLERIDDIVVDLFEEITEQQINHDRKTFAIEVSHLYDPLFRGLMFRFWDEKSLTPSLLYKAVCDTILKHCGSNQSFRKIKEEFLKDVEYED